MPLIALLLAFVVAAGGFIGYWINVIEIVSGNPIVGDVVIGAVPQVLSVFIPFAGAIMGWF